jgi:hypothetical protein
MEQTGSAGHGPTVAALGASGRRRNAFVMKVARFRVRV